MITAQDIEIAVAEFVNFRQNLVVPNVHWGWGLKHEADMLVLRPSGYCDEIEIKVTAADIKADAKKRNSHWDDKRILRVWFAVPHTLAVNPNIPADAGILSVTRGTKVKNEDGLWITRPWRIGDPVGLDKVEVKRTAKLRSKETRVKINDKDRLKLAELGAMRIGHLKTALAYQCFQRQVTKTGTKQCT